MRRVVGVLLAAVVWFGVSARGAEKRDAAKPPSEAAVAADRLVREALAAELAGDNGRRDELLAKALREDPDCRAARWHSGFVSLDGKWLTVADAVDKFSVNQNLAEYRQRRDQAANAGLFNRVASNTTRGGTGVGATTAHGGSVDIHRPSVLSPAGLAAHVELARWCRSKQLSNEERAHWTQVLLDDPANSEAESRLGMKFFMGSLMTNAQIEAVKKQRADEEKQLAEWKPVVSRWRKSLAAGGETERDQAAAEMDWCQDPAVIPALEWAVLTDAPKTSAKRDGASPFQRQAIALLGRLPQQRATYSLAGYAVLSPQAELRSSAGEQLKSRPLHDFVPLLLSGLANPIRFDYAMAFDTSLGVATYRAVASQEGDSEIRQIEYSSAASGLRPKVNGGHFTGSNSLTTKDFTGVNPTKTTVSKYDVTQISVTPGPRNWSEIPGAVALARQSQFLTASIEGTNARIGLMNERINEVLQQVARPEVTSTAAAKPAASAAPAKTAEDPSECAAIPDAALADLTPAAALSIANYWWNWWADYNESHRPEKALNSVTYSDSFSLQNQDHFINSHTETSKQIVYNVPRPVFHPDIPGNPFHCFAAGSLVTAATGPTAIERVQIGDRVLAQDPNTGELAFKPVLGTSKNPPTKLLRIVTSRGDVRLTLGHPFWIEGKGWRMAKELAVGDRVHGLNGSVTIEAIEKQPDEPVYNLTVADFGTFFIGDSQLLVHDNTVRLPSRALVPGYAE